MRERERDRDFSGEGERGLGGRDARGGECGSAERRRGAGERERELLRWERESAERRRPR